MLIELSTSTVPRSRGCGSLRSTLEYQPPQDDEDSLPTSDRNPPHFCLPRHDTRESRTPVSGADPNPFDSTSVFWWKRCFTTYSVTSPGACLW